MNNSYDDILKEFNEFLKEHDALHHYWVNIEHPKIVQKILNGVTREILDTNYENSLRVLGNTDALKLGLIPINSLIDYAFNWQRTPQGHEYWADLNMRWIKKVNS